jgi:uncharacterized ion transporter superfamily protein YfcC
MAAAEKPQERDERPLGGAEKRVLALLGLPTFGLALGITVVTTYVPLLAQQFTSSTTVIGLVIGAEGLVALVVPLVAEHGLTSCARRSADDCRSCLSERPRLE